MGNGKGLLQHRVTCIISLVVLNCTRARIYKPVKKSTGIDSQPGGPVRQSYLTYRPARLLRLAESITGLIKGLHIRALVLSRTAKGLILTVAINYSCMAMSICCATLMFPHLFCASTCEDPVQSVPNCLIFIHTASVPTVVALDSSFLQLYAFTVTTVQLKWQCHEIFDFWFFSSISLCPWVYH